MDEKQLILEQYRIYNDMKERFIERSFDNLGTDYVDLFLVHWPYPVFRDVYKILTSMYKEGRIRAIGVCSCLPPHIEALKEVSDVMPAVNQIEISPLLILS